MQFFLYFYFAVHTQNIATTIVTTKERLRSKLKPDKCVDVTSNLKWAVSFLLIEIKLINIKLNRQLLHQFPFECLAQATFIVSCVSNKYYHY